MNFVLKNIYISHISLWMILHNIEFTILKKSAVVSFYYSCSIFIWIEFVIVILDGTLRLYFFTDDHIFFCIYIYLYYIGISISNAFAIQFSYTNTVLCTSHKAKCIIIQFFY